MCARQFHLVNAKLAALGSKQLAPISFMRCKANGNFEPYQTHLHYAYCVHAANGTLWDRPVVRKSEKDLPCSKWSCFDKFLHPHPNDQITVGSVAFRSAGKN